MGDRGGVARASPALHGAIVLAAAGALLLVGFPLAELFGAAGSQGLAAVVTAFRGNAAARAIATTLGTGGVVTLLGVLGGTAAAFATERGAPRGRSWLRGAVLLPLVVPPFVAALSWGQAYGPAGLVDDLLGLEMPGVYGLGGVVTVLTVHAVPLVYLVVAAALASRAEPDLERAARSSGASAATVFRTVTLPLLRPAIVAGAALAFVTTVNAFGVPAVLGTPAGVTTVTTRIYSDLVFAADPEAFTRVLVLASGLVLLTLSVVGVADVRDALGTGLTRTGAPLGSAVPAGSRWPGAVLWSYALVTSVLPLVALVLVGITRALGLAPVPANWTLGHFRAALGGLGGPALARSVLLAMAAATAVLLLGGLLTALRRQRGGKPLATMATLTFAVPGSALAVAVLLAYGPWLRDTLALILIAYLAKFWALGHRTIAGAAGRQPPELAWAARASGAGPTTTLRTVTIPLLLPALAGAWLVVFLFGLHEVTMSSLLYGPGSETLAVVILNLRQLGDVPVTAALAVLLTGMVLLGTALLSAASRTSRRLTTRRDGG
ncbi:MAG: ABC transporter permease subunit [Actinomycetota bacterium]|nr:ABC transporter permease subunit [Actinomycetota bacterium]